MIPDPDERPPQVDPTKMTEALSHRLRVEIAKVLEKGGATLQALEQELDGKHSIEDVAYQLGVLDAAGCLDRADPEEGSDEGIYRLRSDVLLDPLLLERPVAFEDQESLNPYWLDIEVDQVGEAQVLEVMRGTRLQLLMAEEQSLARHEMTERKLTKLIVGVVGFRSAGSEGAQ